MSSYESKYGKVIIHHAAPSVATSSTGHSTYNSSYRSSSSSYYTMDSERSSSEASREQIYREPDAEKYQSSSKTSRHGTTVFNHRKGCYDPDAPSPSYGNTRPAKGKGKSEGR